VALVDRLEEDKGSRDIFLRRLRIVVGLTAAFGVCLLGGDLGLRTGRL
jgi:hypothetical protein